MANATTPVIQINEGNVGIGTTSPDYKLDVDGDIRARDAIRVYGNTVTTLPYNSPSEVSVNLGTYNNQYAYIDLATSHDGGSWIDFSKADGTDYGGRIRYANSSDQFQFSTNNSQKMVIESGGNVGIGTTNPLYKLQVQDRIHIEDTTSQQPKISFSENTSSTGEFVLEYNGVGGGAGNYVAFYSEVSGWASKGNGLNYIPSLGNVGIGTTSPSAKLDLAGKAHLLKLIHNNGYIEFLDTANANRTGYLQLNSDSSSALNVTVNQPLHFATNNINRLTITETGNVGIGTTSPSEKLTVKGAISAITSDYVQGTTGSRLLMHSAGTGNSHSYIQAQSSGGTSNAEDLALQLYGGKVGIGTDSPSEKLHVAGNIRLQSANRIYFGGTGSIPYWTAGVSNLNNFEIGGVSYFSGDRDILLTPVNNGNVGIKNTAPSYTLDVTGNGRYTSTVTATNFILSSDKRLKDNIKEIDTNHVDVNWKNFELKSEPGIKRSGVIAQELEEKHPEFVRTDKDGFKSVAYIDLLIAKIAELEARLEKAGI